MKDFLYNKKMNLKTQVYRDSLALHTDLYELTMAYGYWKAGVADHEAVFHHFYRKNPFKGGYTIACGLALVIDFLKDFHFDDADIAYLSNLQGSDHKPLFEKEFLNSLKSQKWSWDIDAIPEGNVVFPYEPLLRVKGPILQAQILETALLNIVNFQTLIATKASRICQAAESREVIEFGLRRAQGIDGGIAEARAAYIGGCASTSNVLAGKLFGIPVKGTMAHSWIMFFDHEKEAFEAYAKALPNNCLFLVDTYDTLEGVRHAIEVGKKLRNGEAKMLGVRLDSGDLAVLSREARKLLDEAGFHQAKIIASGELDEYAITDLLQKKAPIDIWGVGTKLATGFDEPALGGVYKLSAVRKPQGDWQYRVKISQQIEKVTCPGILQVRRFQSRDKFIGDTIYNEHSPFTLKEGKDLLVPIFRQGKCVYESPPIDQIRKLTLNQLEHLKPKIKRLADPDTYKVELEANLLNLKTQLIQKKRA
jgi:nicotinate phosphoribosyltransferase